MPNAILRAGPFATSSDSFVNKPLVANSSTLPVNCANDPTSPTWPWQYLLTTRVSATNHTGWEDTPGGESPETSSSLNTTNTYETTTGNFSKNASVNTNLEASSSVSLFFYYQAVEDFQITITYNGTVTSGSSSQIVVSGIDSSTTGSLSGEQSITLQKSVVPKFFSVSMTSTTVGGYPYADYPTVFGQNKTVSATLGISF